MSTPSNDDTPKPADALEQKVNSVLAQATKDESGKLIVPDEVKKDLDEVTLFAVRTEQRRRDTQASYTKSQQSLKAVEKEKEALLAEISGPVNLEISPELQEELDSLQIEDPNAWRLRMNKLEQDAKASSQAKLTEIITAAGQTASTQFELERRQQVLEEFNAKSKVQITQDLIDNEVAPRITKKLASGEITWEQYLEEVVTYIGKGKAVPKPETLNQPNLGKVGGDIEPSSQKAEGSLSAKYANDIY